MLDLDTLDIEISRLRGIPEDHMPATYYEYWLAVENNGAWDVDEADGWGCPRCGASEDDKGPCFIKWSRSWEKAGILEKELRLDGLLLYFDTRWTAETCLTGDCSLIMVRGVELPEVVARAWRARMIYRQTGNLPKEF